MADSVNTADGQAKSGGDAKIVGNPDDWRLLTKFSSDSMDVNKSSKAYEIPGLGCLVQVTTNHRGAVAEALTFVPGAMIVDGENGGAMLVKGSDR